MEMGLFEDWNEQDKIFDESIQIHYSPKSAWYMLFTMYQNGLKPRIMFERHDAHM